MKRGHNIKRYYFCLEILSRNTEVCQWRIDLTCCWFNTGAVKLANSVEFHRPTESIDSPTIHHLSLNLYEKTLISIFRCTRPFLSNVPWMAVPLKTSGKPSYVYKFAPRYKLSIAPMNSIDRFIHHRWISSLTRKWVNNVSFLLSFSLFLFSMWVVLFLLSPLIPPIKNQDIHIYIYILEWICFWWNENVSSFLLMHDCWPLGTSSGTSPLIFNCFWFFLLFRYGGTIGLPTWSLAFLLPTKQRVKNVPHKVS